MTAVKIKLFVFLQFKNTEKSSQCVKYPNNYKNNSTENKRHKKLIKTNKIGSFCTFSTFCYLYQFQLYVPITKDEEEKN